MSCVCFCRFQERMMATAMASMFYLWSACHIPPTCCERLMEMLPVAGRAWRSAALHTFVFREVWNAGQGVKHCGSSSMFMCFTPLPAVLSLLKAPKQSIIEGLHFVPNKNTVAVLLNQILTAQDTFPISLNAWQLANHSVLEHNLFVVTWFFGNMDFVEF